ncbi:polysaccharide pyruvyl transferase family protein [Coraliomargarita sp. W4R53]
MKIKTITCHDIYNYGAGLQAYALMTYLTKQGHEVEIIDYKPDYLSRRLSLTTTFPFYQDKPRYLQVAYILAKLPSRLIANADSCKKAFDDFNQKHLRLTKKRYSNFKQLKQLPPPADAYIAGSDQIWNTTYRNGRDPAFYLEFAPKSARRISYAASMSTREIVPEYLEFFTQAVRQIDHISVRESMSVDILNALGIDKAEHVLDPVFLLDADEWMGLAEPAPEEKYLLIYDFEERDSIAEFAKEEARRRGLKIYALNNYSKTTFADRDFYKSGPSTFLSLIRNAEIVLGNSFHGMAFSILFQREFYAFRRENEGHEQTSFRMEDLLSTCGIEGRLLSPSDLPTSPNRDPIDYQRVSLILEQKKASSKKFLAEALKA